jgi:PAS domain S-box-containing protein
MYLEVLAGGSVLCGVWTMLRCARDRADAAARLHAVTLSSIADAVIATDLSGSITFINPEAERLTGWPRADALGCALDTVFRVVKEDTGDAADNPVSAVLRSGQPQALSNHTRLE